MMETENSIKLSISTADGGGFDRQVSYVNLPTSYGSLGIMRGHAPMLCAVGRGTVRFRLSGGDSGSVTVGPGVATVADNEVVLLVRDIIE